MTGRLYVGHPVGIDAMGVAVPEAVVLLQHPSERAARVLAIANAGVDVFWSDPYTADEFQPYRVMVVSRTGKVAPLTEHPEFERWIGLPTGEMWAMLGEDWVDGL